MNKCCPHCNRPVTDGRPTTEVDGWGKHTTYNAKGIARHTSDVPVKRIWHTACVTEFSQTCEEWRREEREERVRTILDLAAASGVEVDEAEIRARVLGGAA